jgi:hypothetical protein
VCSWDTYETQTKHQVVKLELEALGFEVDFATVEVN